VGKTIYVTCPFCAGMMEVKSESGDVIQKWSSKDRLGEGGDKMSFALKKLEDAKKRRASLFDIQKEELEGQKKKSEQSFQQAVEKAKKEGVSENPIRPFDLD